MDLEQIMRWPPTREKWQALKRYLQGQRLTVGQGLRGVRSPSSGILVSAPRQRPVAGAGGCPNWNVRFAVGAASKIQLFYDNPSTIGAIMPTFGSTPVALDADPQPQITVADAAGTYLAYLRFEWEPDVEEVSAGVWVQTGTGTMIEIEVVVAILASPPTDVTGTINGATGAVTANWEQHRRVTSVVRAAGGGLSLNQHDLCGALEYAICFNRVRLGRL